MSGKLDIKVDKQRKLVFIDGKAYRVELDEEEQVEFLPTDVKRMDKFVNEISNYLLSKVDKETILKDALCDMTMEELEGLHTRLFKAKRKPKITAERGCLKLKVGAFEIPIR